MKKIFSIVILCFLLSSCEAVFVENISGSRIEILAPQEATSVTEGKVNFSWKLLEDAEQYRLKIAQPNFTSAAQIVLDTVITTSALTFDLVKGNYEWQIVGLNAEYATQEVNTSFIVN